MGRLDYQPPARLSSGRLICEPLGGNRSEPDGEEAKNDATHNVHASEEDLARTQKSQSLQAEGREGREATKNPGEEKRPSARADIPKSVFQQQLGAQADSERPRDIHKKNPEWKTCRPRHRGHPLSEKPPTEAANSTTGHDSQRLLHIRGIVMPRWPMYFPARSA